MGVFDLLKGSAGKAGAAIAGLTAEESAVSKLLGPGGANLFALLEKLKLGGLEDVAKSWIGKGENKPVTAEQVKAALGPEEVGAVAKDMGVSQDAAASKIAALLPGIIDKLTPDGLVPDPNAIAKKLTGILKL